MKNFFIIFALILLTQINVSANTSQNNDIFETYSVNNIFNQQKSDKAQIRSLLSNLNKYSNSHDADKIKEFYSKE